MTPQESAGDGAFEQTASAVDLLTEAISLLLGDGNHIAAAHAQAALDHLIQGEVLGS